MPRSAALEAVQEPGAAQAVQLGLGGPPQEDGEKEAA